MYHPQIGRTTTLLLKLRDNIKKATAKCEVTLSVLIDYSKAFDTIDHGMPLTKLQNLNFSKDPIEILSSYLKNRFQYVEIEDKQSIKRINFGVPQGSILGPVLFNYPFQYVDDTMLYRHSKINSLLMSVK